MSEIWNWEQVKHLALFGGGHDAFKAVWECGSKCKPCAHALELYPLMNLEYSRRKHFEDLREKNVLIFAFNVFGVQSNLLTEPTVMRIAEQHGVDPTSIILRWAQEMGKLFFNAENSRTSIIFSIFFFKF